MDSIISKFSSHLKSVLTRALTLVIEQKGKNIEPEHLFWALGTQMGSVASETLLKSGVVHQDLNDFANFKKKKIDKILPIQKVPSLSKNSKIIIEKAVLIASKYDAHYIGTEHLLFSLLKTKEKKIESFLRESQVGSSLIEKNLQNIFNSTKQLPAAMNISSEKKNEIESLLLGNLNNDKDDEDSKTPALDYFTEELTDKEFASCIDPVIGREKEISRLMKIVARRTKNNPILIGEPGVGKTAIVEGLAKRIAEGNVPDNLKNKRIFQLDLAALIAGTMYRGEFESRLKQLVEEIEDLPEIILFIDEVHSIMGAGASSGSLDAANMLKPALARGTIRCIGATTPSEYKKSIEIDGALERRFQTIRVEEPSIEKTRAILHGLKKYYEEHHDVQYCDDAIEAALRLSDRFMIGKQFPDKAIDLLDEAGAAASIYRPSKQNENNKQEEIASTLFTIEKEKKEAVASENFKKAVILKEKEDTLRKSLAAFNKKTFKQKIQINDEDIIAVVAEITGVTIKQLNKEGRRELAGLAKKLQKHVIGQNNSIKEIARSIVRAKLGFAEKNKPLSSFLFIGPSGVGKTELGKAIAKEVFQNKKALLRLDMSEFSSAFSVSKLIGSPAGYIGYRESSLLTDHVKNYPHSVILFDELEKAHPEVVHTLLQILDEGELTDATGKTVSFRNSIIVLTSNIASDLFEKSTLGFEKNDAHQKERRNNKIRENAREHFSRELINRLQHLCIFDRLTKKDIESITKKQLNELLSRLEEADICLDLKKNTAEFIAKKVELKYGGRDINRVIQKQIEYPLSNAIVRTKAKDKLHFSFKIGKDGKATILHKKKSKK